MRPLIGMTARIAAWGALGLRRRQRRGNENRRPVAQVSALTSHFIARLELPAFEFAVIGLLENPINTVALLLRYDWTPNIDPLVNQAHEDGHRPTRGWS